MSNDPLTWETRRALIDNPKTVPADLSAAARNLLEGGFLSEAASFFISARDAQGLTQVMDQAVENGNFFVFNQAAAFLGPAEAGPAKQQRLIEAAEKAGFFLYAEKARNFRKTAPSA